MDIYKINESTLALVPIDENRTKVYESDNIIVIPQNSKKIIEENCRYYGSSFEGRKQGTTELIGVTHKSPIIIEDSHEIIFFPTTSPRGKNCCWLSLNNIDCNRAFDGDTLIRFSNNLTLRMEVSNKIINNQILRATRLGSVHQRRKKEIEEKKHRNTKKSI